jgi:heme exporter protein C
MKKIFVPLVILTAALFAYSPIMIANAPYESTMLLVQKIFYYHFATWMALTAAVTVCFVASGIYLFKGHEWADRMGFAAAEVTVIFGLFGLVSGSLWGRKAWGVWWQWDARLTMSFVGWLIALAYLVLRKYGGPGSEKLAAGLALFGAANVPFIYISVNIWRTIHPQTTVATSLPAGMRGPFWFCVTAFFLLYLLLMTARVHLERQRTALDDLYLAVED